MAEMIAKIWYGNLAPIEHFGEHSREMHDLEWLMQRNQEALERLLDEPAQKAFERYNNAVQEYQLLSIEQAFGDGFAVGIMLLAEASSRAERLQD